MFSGIIEDQGDVLGYKKLETCARLRVSKPDYFNDIKPGDSISVNGVCLTVENFTNEEIQFVLAMETLTVTGWGDGELSEAKVNLERSLSLDARIHGHLVTGHVDAMGEVVSTEKQGECLLLGVQFPKSLREYIWEKGSLAINGVSLTINQVEELTFYVCIIPETLKRTNLGALEKGSSVTLEIDNLARGLVHQQKILESEK